MSSNDFICKCKELSLEEIKSLEKEYGIKTLKELVKHTKAGTECGGCRNKLKEMFEEVGLQKVTYKQFSLGAVVLHIGYKSL